MSWHPTEEDLILHFYGEGAAEEPRIDEHLRGCPSCQAAWEDLSETLKLVDAATMPEPGPGFERVVWARLQPALGANSAPTPRWWSVRRLAPVALGVAALAAAVALGYMWRPAPAPAGESAVVMPVKPKPDGQARARERVLLSALNDHFAQTELLLVELMNTPPDGTNAMAFERTAAEDLVASGRLYRMTAEQNGDLQFAQMLEDIEAILVEVARSPGRPNRKDMQSLRARIDDTDLLFKVRAVSNAIHVRQKDLMSAND